MQNSMVVFTFSALDWKHLFQANLVQKIKIVSLSWNLFLLTHSNMQNSMVIFIIFFVCLRPKTPFLSEFGPKNQNCQFKLKFGT